MFSSLKNFRSFAKTVIRRARQRVAIGRAIIRDHGLLFDEPLSNLDAALRVNMRLEIARLQKQLGITTIYVTHDQVEAMTLADRILVLKDGKIMQVGSPRTLYNTPKNKFVAEFIGNPKMNLMPCQVTKKLRLLSSKPQDTKLILDVSDDISWFGIRPEHLNFCAIGKAKLKGQLVAIEYLGSDQFAYVDCGFEHFVTVRSDPNKELELNGEVGLDFDLLSSHLFDVKGNRI